MSNQKSDDDTEEIKYLKDCGMEPVSVPLNKVVEQLAQQTFGRSRQECWIKGLCISCGEPALAKCHSTAGKNEYYISCLCEQCFDNICAPSDSEKGGDLG